MPKIKTTSITKEGFNTINQVRDFNILMDNMPEDGGTNYGASPKEHLCMALGSCTTMTIKTYLNRKQWPCQSLRASTLYTLKDGISKFNIHITIHGGFNEQQQKRIKQIAKLCPIQKMLSSGSDIDETFEFILLDKEVL